MRVFSLSIHITQKKILNASCAVPICNWPYQREKATLVDTPSRGNRSMEASCSMRVLLFSNPSCGAHSIPATFLLRTHEVSLASPRDATINGLRKACPPAHMIALSSAIQVFYLKNKIRSQNSNPRNTSGAHSHITQLLIHKTTSRRATNNVRLSLRPFCPRPPQARMLSY